MTLIQVISKGFNMTNIVFNLDQVTHTIVGFVFMVMGQILIAVIVIVCIIEKAVGAAILRSVIGLASK